MARDAFKDNADKSGVGRNSDAWANNMEKFRDPVSGKQLNSTGDWRKESELAKGPAPTAPTKPGDSTA
jgi:hypothetical protein